MKESELVRKKKGRDIEMFAVILVLPVLFIAGVFGAAFFLELKNYIKGPEAWQRANSGKVDQKSL